MRMELFKFTDPFCGEHLDAEYAELIDRQAGTQAPLAARAWRPSHLGSGGDLRRW